MKYPKITGYYVYAHITPEKDCYFGISQQQPTVRFTPSHYKGTTLLPYIEQFGWDNIEHVVLFDGLTKHQAEVLEDWFIANATQNGFCINKNRSGGCCIDNIKVYYREYRRNRYQNDSEYKEQQREYQNNYRHNRYQNDTEYRNKIKEYSQRPEVKEQRREQQRNRYQNDPEYREKIKERQRQYHLKKKKSTQ